MEIIELTGTPEEMARQHAEACYDSAREMIRARCDLALKRARQLDGEATMERCLRLAGDHLPAHEDYSPRGYAEFMALATSDFRKIDGKGVGAPLRVHLNAGYRVDNSGKLVEDVETLRAQLAAPSHTYGPATTDAAGTIVVGRLVAAR